MSTRATVYPWLTVLTGLLMLTFTNGLINSSISVFDEPLLKEFAWQRGDLKFREFVTSAVAARLVFFSGSLIDRFVFCLDVDFCTQSPRPNWPQTHW